MTDKRDTRPPRAILWKGRPKACAMLLPMLQIDRERQRETETKTET